MTRRSTGFWLLITAITLAAAGLSGSAESAENAPPAKVAGPSARTAGSTGTGARYAFLPNAGSKEPGVANQDAESQARALAQLPPALPPRGHRIVVDRSGRKQAGKASTYAPRFEGRRMADGRRFRQEGDAAASKTLPIGTVAKVTNTVTGRTATVTVQDHGPFVDGRTLDVSRTTARQLGISRKDGVAPVVVAPVLVPQENGAVKVGMSHSPQTRRVQKKLGGMSHSPQTPRRT
jgi:rare lipoprotein A